MTDNYASMCLVDRISEPSLCFVPVPPFTSGEGDLGNDG